MAQIINSDKDFKVIEVYLSDCIKWGGLGICDHCNTAIRKGYYVAVLNSVLCEKCYKSWHHRAKNYPEDRRIEESNFNRMKSILNL